jgi:hypothetical protein
MLRQRRGEFWGLNYYPHSMRESASFFLKGSCFLRFKNKCKASHPKMLLFLFNDSDYQRMLMGRGKAVLHSELLFGVLRCSRRGLVSVVHLLSKTTGDISRDVVIGSVCS